MHIVALILYLVQIASRSGGDTGRQRGMRGPCLALALALALCVLVWWGFPPPRR